MNRLIEIINEEFDEIIQTYVDIIDGLDNNDVKKQKYINILKDKYNYIYQEGNDDELISKANLNNINLIGDFSNYQNYIKYAKKINQLRNITDRNKSFMFNVENPNHDKLIDFNTAQQIGELLGFDVSWGENIGGNYALANPSHITIPQKTILYTLIHEIGHVYDYKYYKTGISKLLTNSPTMYGTQNAGEVFAENFAAYFLAPNWLKTILPDVYNDLNNNIDPKWKTVINSLLDR